MSDTRRRRKSSQSCGSDDLSDSYEDHNTTKETQVSIRNYSDCKRKKFFKSLIVVQFVTCTVGLFSTIQLAYKCDSENFTT